MFDFENDNEGGGGGDNGRHDPQKLEQCAESALLSLEVNADVNDVCVICAGMTLHAKMTYKLIELALDKHGHEGGEAMAGTIKDALNMALMFIDKVEGKLQ